MSPNTFQSSPAVPKTLPLLLFLLLAAPLAAHGDFKCGNSKLGPRPPPMAVEVEDGQGTGWKARLLQTNTTTWRPIKILFDFTYVTGTNAAVTEFLKSVLIAEVQARLQSLLYVRGSTVIPRFSSTSCDDDITVPSSYASSTTTADLIIFVKTFNDPSSDFLAVATSCLVRSGDYRPIVGFIMVNLAELTVDKNSASFYNYVLTHELIHVLALSPELFDTFPLGANNTYTSQQVKRSDGTTGPLYTLITPGIMSYGRTYFNCASFAGLRLEDEGTDASANAHFEKLLVGNEMMTASATGKMVMSMFTLHLLNDCGWYQVDFTIADRLIWGQNRGCGFLNRTCSTIYPEFCSTRGAMSCTTDYTSKVACQSSSFSDGCLVNDYDANYNCNLGYTLDETSPYEFKGAFSRCFQTNSNAGVGCYKASCSGTNSVTITLNNVSSSSANVLGNNSTNSTVTLTCQTSGQVVTYGDVSITCPDISDFCTQLAGTCNNDCSGQGRCRLSGGCYCDFLYQGSACDSNVTCNLSSTVCTALTVADSGTTYASSSWSIAKSWLGLLVLALYVIA